MTTTDAKWFAERARIERALRPLLKARHRPEHLAAMVFEGRVRVGERTTIQAVLDASDTAALAELLKAAEVRPGWIPLLVTDTADSGSIVSARVNDFGQLISVEV